jgi:uncharacterized protein YdaT
MRCHHELLSSLLKAAQFITVPVSNKHDTDEELPTAIPIATSSTSKTWEKGNKIGHHEQYGSEGTVTGRSNIHNTGDQSTQYHQERNLGDLANRQVDQGHGKTVSQYEKGYQYGVGKAAHDKHVENALLKSELYGDPGRSLTCKRNFLRFHSQIVPKHF